jgi:hypothetical protein
VYGLLPSGAQLIPVQHGYTPSIGILRGESLMDVFLEPHSSSTPPTNGLDRIEESASDVTTGRKIAGFCAMSVGMVDYSPKKTNLLEAVAGTPGLHRRGSDNERNPDPPRRPAVRQALPRSRRSHAPATRAIGPEANRDRRYREICSLGSPSMSTMSINSTPKRTRGERAARGAPLGPPEALAADVRQRGSASRQRRQVPSQRKKLAIFDRPSLGRC